MAQIIVNAGGIAAIIDYIDNSKGTAKLPGIMTLGYISVFSETLAFSVLLAKPIPILLKILMEKNTTDESVLVNLIFINIFIICSTIVNNFQSSNIIVIYF